MNLNPHIVQLMRNVNEVAIDERIERSIERSMFPDKDVVYIESRAKSVLAKKMAEHIVEHPRRLHHRFDVLSDSDIYSIRGIWVDREELYKILLAAYEIGRTYLTGYLPTEPIAGGPMAARIADAQIARDQYLSQMHEDRRRQLEEENNRMQYQTINKYGKKWNI
jgi:hypothetical protein